MYSCMEGKMFFIINIVFGLFGAIVANKTIVDNMSPEDIQNFFGSTDVPEYQLITFDASPRTKRDTRLTINADFQGTRLTSTLNLITDPYLFGRNTAIWHASTDRNSFKSVRFYPDPKVLERIGDFDFYQDLQKGSALTYFRRNQTYTGVLCENYAIKAVPASWTRGVINPMFGHAVKMRSVDSQENKHQESSSTSRHLHVIFRIPQASQESFLLRRPEDGWTQSEPNHDRQKRQNGQNPPSVVYPKILLTTDYGAIKGFHVDEIMIYLISFLNGVDMLYRQLASPAVRLRIAGVIIPTDGTATPFIAPETSTDFNLNADYVLNNTGLHFWQDSERFPLNSYDIIMTLTRKRIGRYGTNGHGPWEPLGGLALISSACAKAQNFYGNPNAIGGVGISTFDWIFGGVAVMAHELGHVLGVADHDGQGVARSCPATGGYTMTPGANFARTLAWTTCSRQAFTNYLSGPLASCLRSPPRVIKPALQRLPGSWLSINGHCSNERGNSRVACILPNTPGVCFRFGCMVNGRCEDTNLRPSDGSPCGNGQYCLNTQCVSI